MPVFRILFAVILLMLVGTVLAQTIGRNDAIPNCTPSQAKQLVGLFDAVTLDFTLEQVREQEQRSDYPFRQFDMYMKILRNYDEDLKPRLQNCALALRFESALYRLVAAKGYWNGANMLVQEGAMFGADFDADRFLKLEDVLPIAEIATEEFDAIWQELNALAEEAE